MRRAERGRCRYDTRSPWACCRGPRSCCRSPPRPTPRWCRGSPGGTTRSSTTSCARASRSRSTAARPRRSRCWRGRELAADASDIWRSRRLVLVLALAPSCACRSRPRAHGRAGPRRPPRDRAGTRRGVRRDARRESVAPAGLRAAASPTRGPRLAGARARPGRRARSPGCPAAGRRSAWPAGGASSRADAYRLSWTVALPVIAGAGMLQGLRLRRAGVPAALRPAMAAGAGAAFCSTLAAGGAAARTHCGSAR